MQIFGWLSSLLERGECRFSLSGRVELFHAAWNRGLWLGIEFLEDRACQTHLNFGREPTLLVEIQSCTSCLVVHVEIRPSLSMCMCNFHDASLVAWNFHS